MARLPFESAQKKTKRAANPRRTESSFDQNFTMSAQAKDEIAVDEKPRAADFDYLLRRQASVRRCEKRLRTALRELGNNEREADDLLEGLLPPVPGLSPLEQLPDALLTSVVEFSPMTTVAMSSRTLRECKRRCQWGPRMRRLLKELFETGMEKVKGMNLRVMDLDGGLIDRCNAAIFGYRPAIARSHLTVSHLTGNEEQAKALLEAEHASKPSEASGGECIWCAFELAKLEIKLLKKGEGGDPAKALALLQEAVEVHNNSAAAYYVSRVYRVPSFFKLEAVVTRDRARSKQLLLKSSDAGFLDAMEDVAFLCERGYRDFDRNLPEAARLYRMVIERGDCPVRAGLTRLYTEGLNRTLAQMAAEGIEDNNAPAAAASAAAAAADE